MPDTTDEPELWTVEQVADHLGYRGPSAKGSARKQMSRWGVARHDVTDSPTGRIAARYRADDVRAAAASRPGAGYRSDLGPATPTSESTGDDGAAR